jgi:hypothetical protein
LNRVAYGGADLVARAFGNRERRWVDELERAIREPGGSWDIGIGFRDLE